jgi:hypothetical protein
VAESPTYGVGGWTRGGRASSSARFIPRARKVARRAASDDVNSCAMGSWERRLDGELLLEKRAEAGARGGKGRRRRGIVEDGDGTDRREGSGDPYVGRTSTVKTHPTGTRIFDDVAVNHGRLKIDPTAHDFLSMWQN